MPFYTYILESQIDGSFYIGYTANLDQRLIYHNSGRGRYTRKKMPWDLVYQEEFQTKREALQRERYLKRMKSHAFLKDLIS